MRPAPATASATFVVDVMFDGSVKVSILYWVEAWGFGESHGDGSEGPGRVQKVNYGVGACMYHTCIMHVLKYSAAPHLRVDMVVVDRVDHRLITSVDHNLVAVARRGRGHCSAEGTGAKHTDLHRRVTQVVTRQFRVHCREGKGRETGVMK